MALDIKSASELVSLIINSLIQAINSGQTDSTKNVDPSIRNSFIGGFSKSMAVGFDDNNRNIKKVEAELFPPSSSEDGFLLDWGVIFGINRNESAKAVGDIVFSGTVTGIIPVSTLLQRANGLQYTTLTETTIAQQTINVSSITRTGSTATVITASAHNLASNFVIDNIAGAAETEYNVTNAIITVIDPTSFTYQVTGSPTSPATGTITVTFTSAFTDIEASEAGIDGNTDEGTQLTLVSPIANVDNTAIVGAEGLTGGLDNESIPDLKDRIQERTSNLVNVFAAKGLEIFVKENVDGVTRVFVQDSFAPTKTVGLATLISDADGVTIANPSSAITDFINGSFITTIGANEPELIVQDNAAFQKINGDIIFSIDTETAKTGTGTLQISYSTVPAGRTVIYFVRDNDINIIPTAQQVQDVKDAIIDPDNEVKPANTPDDFVIVKAPIGISVDVTFASLSPNTDDMQSAITTSLEEFFRNDTTLGVSITEEEFNNIIFATIDSEGNRPIFSLTLPSGDVVIDDGEIAVLGTIIYS